ncbi:hypothetical protein SOVF_148290 [Spinacia oleracea]|nr:hypothetical protein SOVF_148290 [Spinacia oleracea]
MCKEKGSPFGAADVCERYGLAYASLSMAIGSVYFWLYAYNIVRISSKEAIANTGVIAETFVLNVQPETEPPLQSSEFSLQVPRLFNIFLLANPYLMIPSYKRLRLILVNVTD